MSVAEKLTTIAENQQKVFEAGKIKEYDEFWDAYQKNGATQNYIQAFYSNRWTDTNYKPKYPLICTACSSMFNSATITDTLVDIDISACSGSQYLFGYCTSLQTIRKLIVGENTTFSDSFVSCRALKNITIEGTIGKNLSLSNSTLLSKASIENIVSCLSATVTGQTLTLSQTAVDNAFTEDEWSILIADKTNWTFSLV